MQGVVHRSVRLEKNFLSLPLSTAFGTTMRETFYPVALPGKPASLWSMLPNNIEHFMKILDYFH